MTRRETECRGTKIVGEGGREGGRKGGREGRTEKVGIGGVVAPSEVAARPIVSCREGGREGRKEGV